MADDGDYMTQNEVTDVFAIGRTLSPITSSNVKPLDYPLAVIYTRDQPTL